MKKFLLPEAGGDAARSAYYFLRRMGVAPSAITAIDRSPKALKVWSDLLSCNAELDNDNTENYYENYTVVPCDEYYRERLGLTSTELSSYDHLSILKKNRQHEIISTSKNQDILPPVVDTHPVGAYVSRENRSSGSKSVKVLRGRDAFIAASQGLHVVKYYDFDYEVVCDFSKSETSYASTVRLTHDLKSGADTFVTLLPDSSLIHAEVTKRTSELVNLFGFKGIGNAQYGVTRDNQLKFIEISPRLSGSSYLEELFNPILFTLTDGASGFVPRKSTFHVSNKFMIDAGTRDE